MAGKQMEGDNRQRRARAQDAREQGRLPSEDAVTQGASKQRHHLERDTEHGEKLEAIRRGKQRSIRKRGPEPSPGSTGSDRPG